MSIKNIFIVFFALVLGCAVSPVTGKREIMLISQEQEIAIGRDIFPNAIWGAEGGGGEYKDDALKSYLKDIVIKIHGVSHRANLPIEFRVQNTSVPNAWAVPCYVVITRGLLAGLKNEAEFAFIIGHEIGHISARHTAKRLTYGLLRQIGLGAVAQRHDDIILMAGEVGSALALLKYSRQQEIEADRLAVEYMARLGYDPKNAVLAHKRLEKIYSLYLSSVGKEEKRRTLFEDMLSTHPRTSVRIDEIEEMIKTLPRGQWVEDGRERFLSMTEGLRRANSIYIEYYDKAIREFENSDFEKADQLLSAITEASIRPQALTLKGFIALKTDKIPEAERYFKEAISLDKNYQPALRGLGIYNYTKGRYDEAILALKDAVLIYPEDIYSRYFLGMSLYKKDRCDEALRHLNYFAEAMPKHTEIHGILGICYEKINDPVSAYREYLLQVKIAPNTEMGVHAAKRLQIIKKGMPR